MKCVSCFEEAPTSTRCATCGGALHKACAMQCSCGNKLCDGCFATSHLCKECIEKENTLSKIETVRRSNIELYLRCPYAFYLQVVKGNEQPETIYTKAGIDMHDVFEKYSYIPAGTQILQDMINEYKLVFDKYEESLFTTKATKEKMWIRAIESMTHYAELHPTLPTPFVTERKLFLHVEDGLPTINITMDRVDEDGEGLIIRDWKTGATMVGKKFEEDLQAPLYIMIIENEYKRKVNRFIYHFLGEGKTREFIRIDDDKFGCTVNSRTYIISLQGTMERIKKIFASINAKQFSINNSMKSYTCTMCHLMHNGLCAGKDEQVWKNAKGGLNTWK